MLSINLKTLVHWSFRWFCISFSNFKKTCQQFPFPYKNFKPGILTTKSMHLLPPFAIAARNNADTSVSHALHRRDKNGTRAVHNYLEFIPLMCKCHVKGKPYCRNKSMNSQLNTQCESRKNVHLRSSLILNLQYKWELRFWPSTDTMCI